MAATETIRFPFQAQAAPLNDALRFRVHLMPYAMGIVLMRRAVARRVPALAAKA